MKKNYLLLIIVLIITVVFANITYADRFLDSNNREGLTLLKEFIKNPSLLSRLIILQILFPLVFTLETFLIEYPFRKGIRVLFMIQSIIAAAGIYFTHFLMTLHVFQYSNQYNLNTYLIIVFESVFALWSLLLAMSFTNKIRVFNFIFKRNI
jgi:hypothetical protein